MDYDKMYAEAKAKGTARHLGPRQIKLKEGEVIVGQFLGRDLIKSKKPKMPDFYVYSFERTEETVRFPVSGAFDKGDGARLKVGGVYALEYMGKLDIGQGRQMKEIDVIVIAEPGNDEEDEEEAEEEGEE